MFKKLNKKGFTLAELLVVVAIIGVLVAISIPIFTSQLKKARLATNQANARSAYAAALTTYLGDASDNDTATVYYEYDAKKGDGEKKSTGDTKGTATTLPIASWTVSSSGKLGDAVYGTWYVEVTSSGVTKLSHSAS